MAIRCLKTESPGNVRARAISKLEERAEWSGQIFLENSVQESRHGTAFANTGKLYLREPRLRGTEGKFVPSTLHRCLTGSSWQAGGGGNKSVAKICCPVFWWNLTRKYDQSRSTSGIGSAGLRPN